MTEIARKVEIIKAAVLEELHDQKIPDTPVNRYDILTGVIDAWLEDKEVNIEKSLWTMAAMNLQTEWRLEATLSKKTS